MFWILNRLRGQYSYFAKVNALVVALLIFAFLGNFYLAIICGLGYLAGEAKGWGVWVGALTSHGGGRQGRERKSQHRMACGAFYTSRALDCVLQGVPIYTRPFMVAASVCAASLYGHLRRAASSRVTRSRLSACLRVRLSHEIQI